MRIDQVIQQGVAQLATLSSSNKLTETPELDVQLLLAEVLGVNTSYFYTWPEKQVSEEDRVRFDALLAQRLKGRPIAYILGYQAFWTFELAVSEFTLIPRSDTECLVEIGLELIADVKSPSILDLGTGTGAVALALASERPDANVSAVDLIPEAVELAKQNNQKLNLNVDIQQSSWFDNVANTGFTLIVSNPPYIDPEDHHLDEGDVRFEPKTALIADLKGYSDIEIIARDAKAHLAINGWLAFEHGYDQGEGARKILEKNGYHKIETRKDYGDNDRVTLGQYSGR
ncbi:SAM-dependent methyltransferase [Marinomonas sp. S3726]|uniref:peptide chain release factor N(5)-glutamine methyltransferase n=1 Tax=Marinomonas sp. S3726 TaxID=579484 RepID=UPI0005FA579E|nr:peptide chain release factor N(5)-glutamine methyltransferase [Marinomonas sp. S3726]KJZ14207.1 SAM-dependent methyltransferase [Marinomonas sp. S3726]